MLSVNAQDALENFLQNADFENQGFAPWTMWVEDASAQALMAVDKKISFEGTQSLQIDIKKRGGGKRVELHQNPLFLKKGQKLTLAMWAKVTDDEIRPAKMIVNHRADPWTSYLFKEITIKWEWIEFWATFTMPADDNIVGVYIEMIDNAGQIWFDHFRLYEGNYIEENLGGQKKAIQPNEKMATTWSKVKLLD
jgi:hypothetical protein